MRGAGRQIAIGPCAKPRPQQPIRAAPDSSYNARGLRRVFVSSIEDGVAVIRGDRARHLARVVRIRPGEGLEVSDGRRIFAGEVESAGAAEVIVRLQQEVEPPAPSPAVELLASITKFPRWEMGLEKAVEAGASAVIPVVAARTDGGLAKAASKRLERWRLIAEEAAQQSRQLAAPQVFEPMPFAAALERAAALRVFLDFDGDPLPAILADGAFTPEERLAVLVGPEGGWSEDERSAAAAAGWRFARLGDTTLRAETAAIVGTAFLRQLVRTGEAR